MIPEAALEAAASVLMYHQRKDSTSCMCGWAELGKSHAVHQARVALEAAAPHMLSHEREQTRLAHLDAMVNRETKREELEAAWNDGHLMGWNEATANTLPERDSLWRNPYRKPSDAV